MDIFKMVTIGSIGLLGLMIAIATGEARSKHQVYSQAKRQVQTAEIEAKKIREIAEAYDKYEVTAFGSLLVYDYAYNPDNPVPPNIDWQKTTDPSKCIRIFDKHNRLVGFAEGGNFYFKKEGGCDAK